MSYSEFKKKKKKKFFFSLSVKFIFFQSCYPSCPVFEVELLQPKVSPLSCSSWRCSCSLLSKHNCKLFLQLPLQQQYALNSLFLVAPLLSHLYLKGTIHRLFPFSFLLHIFKKLDPSNFLCNFKGNNCLLFFFFFCLPGF